MGTEVAKRNVKVETTGAFLVEQKDITLTDLRDFVHSAEAHGVPDDAKVHIKQDREYDRETREYEEVTKLACEAPVQLAYGTVGQKALVDPRKRRFRRKMALYAGAGLGVFFLLPAVLLGIGLLVRFFHFAYGWI